MEEFIPTTFRMDVRAERDAFFVQQEGNLPKHSLLHCCSTVIERPHNSVSTRTMFSQAELGQTQLSCS